MYFVRLPVSSRWEAKAAANVYSLVGLEKIVPFITTMLIRRMPARSLQMERQKRIWFSHSWPKPLYTSVPNSLLVRINTAAR